MGFAGERLSILQVSQAFVCGRGWLDKVSVSELFYSHHCHPQQPLWHSSPARWQCPAKESREGA